MLPSDQEPAAGPSPDPEADVDTRLLSADERAAAEEISRSTHPAAPAAATASTAPLSGSVPRAMPRPMPEPGEVLGDFELLDFIGRGGMGQVYRAHDTRLDRQVALKLLLPGPPTFEQRFQREARAQAKIEHEGICRVYEVGEADGRSYIAMQYLEGQTLAELADELTFEQKIWVMRQVIEAVHAAHLLALVHRDLKPGNIIVNTADGSTRAWVLDFGMAHDTSQAHMTMTGEVVGTPFYMAPEQVRGQLDAIDRRTDVYSLGVILYELLAGKAPIQGSSVFDVLHRIVTEDPRPLRELRPDIPEDLEWIVLRCLEKEPGRRYRSANALLRDLDRFRQGEPVKARQSTWRYRFAKRARKHRRLIAMASVLGMMLVGLGWRDIAHSRAAAEETRLAAHFLREIEGLAWRSRVISTLPLHDTRPERERMKKRLEALEAEVEAAGSVAEGPGFFALGRGYRELGEADKGLDFLERSWNAGFRDPHLSLALGLAYGEKYDESLERMLFEPRPEVRLRQRREVEMRYKAPTVEHLQRALETGRENSAWVTAKLAFYEKRWQAAREALDEVEAASPWRYETQILRADISHHQAIDLVFEDEEDEGRRRLDQADAAIALAIRHGESDPNTYAALCDQHDTRLIFFEEQLAADPEARERLLEPCRQALLADSGSAFALATAALLAESLGESLLWIGDLAALDFYAQSLEWSRRAIALDPAGRRGLDLAHRVSLRSGELALSSTERERYFADALAYVEVITELEPDDLDAAFLLSDTALIRAIYQGQRGEDAEPLFERAAREMLPLVDGEAPSLVAVLHIASIELERAIWRSHRGGDADGPLEKARAALARARDLAEDPAVQFWGQLMLCQIESTLDLARSETPEALANCRQILDRESAEAPEDLDYVVKDVQLLRLELDAGTADFRAVAPRMETLLDRLESSGLYSRISAPRELGYWHLESARRASASEAVPLLRQAIEALDTAHDINDDLEDLLSGVGARLMLAELEGRRGRTEAMRRLLEASWDRLARVSNADDRRIRIRLFDAIGESLEAELEGKSKAIAWDSLAAEPQLRGEIGWWRPFLD